jgi:hypothetical protein
MSLYQLTVIIYRIILQRAVLSSTDLFALEADVTMRGGASLLYEINLTIE